LHRLKQKKKFKIELTKIQSCLGVSVFFRL